MCKSATFLLSFFDCRLLKSNAAISQPQQQPNRSVAEQPRVSFQQPPPVQQYQQAPVYQQQTVNPQITPNQQTSNPVLQSAINNRMNSSSAALLRSAMEQSVAVSTRSRQDQLQAEELSRSEQNRLAALNAKLSSSSGYANISRQETNQTNGYATISTRAKQYTPPEPEEEEELDEEELDEEEENPAEQERISCNMCGRKFVPECIFLLMF